MTELAENLLGGDRRALARAISLVENGTPAARALIKEIFPRTGRAATVGVTGAPGAGKSTLVSGLAREYRRRGKTVGVIAVDPSSPFTGGALLGDRIRMIHGEPDQGIFIRSLASRGHLGGLSRATSDAIALMDAAGKDVIIVEAVGAGQAEVEIMRAVHTTLVVLVPGMGDEIQAIKAGILEIGDVFVVNKADREGADQTASQLEMMLDMAVGTRPWDPPVVKTVARNGTGIDELVDRLEEHLRFLAGSGLLAQRRWMQVAERIKGIVQEQVLAELRAQDEEEGRGRAGGRLADLVARVLAGTLDPYAAAEELWNSLKSGDAAHGK